MRTLVHQVPLRIWTSLPPLPKACAPAAPRDGTSGSGSAETSSEGTILVENNNRERELPEPRVILPVRDGRRVDRSVPRRTRRASTPRSGPYDNDFDDTPSRVTASRIRDTSLVSPRFFNDHNEEGSGARSSQGEFRIAWTGEDCEKTEGLKGTKELSHPLEDDPVSKTPRPQASTPPAVPDQPGFNEVMPCEAQRKREMERREEEEAASGAGVESESKRRTVSQCSVSTAAPAPSVAAVPAQQQEVVAQFQIQQGNIAALATLTHQTSQDLAQSHAINEQRIQLALEACQQIREENDVLRQVVRKRTEEAARDRELTKHDFGVIVSEIRASQEQNGADRDEFVRAMRSVMDDLNEHSRLTNIQKAEMDLRASRSESYLENLSEGFKGVHDMLSTMQQHFHALHYQPPPQHTHVSTATATVVETQVKSSTRAVDDAPKGGGRLPPPLP